MAPDSGNSRGGVIGTGGMRQIGLIGKIGLLTAVLALAGCGGGRVSGEIGQACMSGGRSAANSALCSCVQQAANQSLSGADQRRAATFFAEPQLAQDTRQSDRPQDEAFWLRYRAFSETATAMCG